MTTPNPFTSAILMRRKPEFFIGKVIWLMNKSVTPPAFQAPCYARLTSITGDNEAWDYEYLGTTEPEGEAIYKYHTPGQLDLWAIPRTVWSSKIRNSFIIWGSIVVTLLTLSGLMGNYSGEYAGWVFFWSVIMFGSMMVAPVIKWGLAIEPVFTMKCVYSVMIVAAVLGSRAKRTGNEVRADQVARGV